MFLYNGVIRSITTPLESIARVPSPPPLAVCQDFRSDDREIKGLVVQGLVSALYCVVSLDKKRDSKLSLSAQVYKWVPTNY